MAAEVQTAKERHMEAEKEALRKTMTAENQKLRRRLHDILRRQKEFMFLLHHEGTAAGAEQPTSAFQEKRYFQEMEAVNSKIDELAATLSHSNHFIPSTASLTNSPN